MAKYGKLIKNLVEDCKENDKCGPITQEAIRENEKNWTTYFGKKWEPGDYRIFIGIGWLSENEESKLDYDLHLEIVSISDKEVDKLDDYFLMNIGGGEDVPFFCYKDDAEKIKEDSPKFFKDVEAN